MIEPTRLSAYQTRGLRGSILNSTVTTIITLFYLPPPSFVPRPRHPGKSCQMFRPSYQRISYLCSTEEIAQAALSAPRRTQTRRASAASTTLSEELASLPECASLDQSMSRVDLQNPLGVSPLEDPCTWLSKR